VACRNHAIELRPKLADPHSRRRNVCNFFGIRRIFFTFQDIALRMLTFRNPCPKQNNPNHLS
jgi:hypothetical protein